MGVPVEDGRRVIEFCGFDSRRMQRRWFGNARGSESLDLETVALRKDDGFRLLDLQEVIHCW